MSDADLTTKPPVQKVRHPLTVRWWFRVALVVIVLIGGYGTAYLMLREFKDFKQRAVVVYPDLFQRSYATNVSGLWMNFDLDSGLWRVDPMPLELTEEVVDKYVETTDDAPGIKSAAMRVFYLAERIELMVRGIAPYELAPVGSDKRARDQLDWVVIAAHERGRSYRPARDGPAI